MAGVERRSALQVAQVEWMDTMRQFELCCGKKKKTFPQRGHIDKTLLVFYNVGQIQLIVPISCPEE